VAQTDSPVPLTVKQAFDAVHADIAVLPAVIGQQLTDVQQKLQGAADGITSQNQTLSADVAALADAVKQLSGITSSIQADLAAIREQLGFDAPSPAPPPAPASPAALPVLTLDGSADQPQVSAQPLTPAQLDAFRQKVAQTDGDLSQLVPGR
jgi:hypothetical protein